MTKKVIISVIFIAAVAVLWYLFDGQSRIIPDELTAGKTLTETKSMNNTQPASTNPIATFHTTQGDIGIELFVDRMPITAGNFLKLAREGFYDGIKFHRVIDGFMIQGGDPNSKGDNTAIYGTGGPEYAIEDEFVKGEGLSNVRGTIAMANSGPNSGGSQFFINLVDNTGLDFDKEPLTSKHPVFGRVVSGMEVVDAIGKVAKGARDLPLKPVVIKSVTIVEPSS